MINCGDDCLDGLELEFHSGLIEAVKIMLKDKELTYKVLGTFFARGSALAVSSARLAGVELDLFTHLKDGSMSVEEIARRVDVRADKLKPLLYALAAVGLLTVESGVFPTPVQPIISRQGKCVL